MIKLNKKISIMLLVFGSLCLGIFIYDMILFSFLGPLEQNTSGIYIGQSVVGSVGVFCYYTYWSLLFYGLWLTLSAICNIFDIRKLSKFLLDRRIMLFVVFNEIITLIMFSIFSIIGLFSKQFNFSNLLTFANFETIIVHYIITVSAIVLWNTFPTTQQLNKKDIYLIYIFPLSFFPIISLLGRFAFSVEWYPYAICSPRAFWLIIAGSLDSYNATISICILISLYAISCILVYLIGYALITKNNKRYRLNNQSID